MITYQHRGSAPPKGSKTMTTDKMIQDLSDRLAQELGDARDAGDEAQYAAIMNATMALIKVASSYKANRINKAA
jgi:hypothetical protein